MLGGPPMMHVGGHGHGGDEGDSTGGMMPQSPASTQTPRQWGNLFDQEDLMEEAHEAGRRESRDMDLASSVGSGIGQDDAMPMSGGGSRGGQGEGGGHQGHFDAGLAGGEGTSEGHYHVSESLGEFAMPEAATRQSHTREGASHHHDRGGLACRGGPVPGEEDEGPWGRVQGRGGEAGGQGGDVGDRGRGRGGGRGGDGGRGGGGREGGSAGALLTPTLRAKRGSSSPSPGLPTPQPPCPSRPVDISLFYVLLPFVNNGH